MARVANKRLKVIEALTTRDEGLTVRELAALAGCSYVYAEMVVKRLGSSVQLDGKSPTGANRYRWVPDAERGSVGDRSREVQISGRLPRLDDTLTVVEARRTAGDTVEIVLRRDADGERFRAVIDA